MSILTVILIVVIIALAAYLLKPKSKWGKAEYIDEKVWSTIDDFFTAYPPDAIIAPTDNDDMLIPVWEFRPKHSPDGYHFILEEGLSRYMLVDGDGGILHKGRK